MLTLMSSRQAKADVRTTPKAGYSNEDLNLVGDVLRECRDHVARRRFGSLARTVIARRRDLRMGFALVKSLPVIAIDVPDNRDGAVIRERLGGKLPGVNLRTARAALELPADRETYLRGRPKQALRTNLRHAATEGIVCKTLPRVEDQEAALQAFYATSHFTAEDRRYLGEALHVNPGQQDFYCAEEADGRIIAIAAVAVNERTAFLLFHHSLESEHAAIARYALTMHIVSELIERRVSLLLVSSALTLPPGLRYFQQRLGFRAVNVRLANASKPTPRTDAAVVVHSG
jgi:hypothetical protein